MPDAPTIGGLTSFGSVTNISAARDAFEARRQEAIDRVRRAADISSDNRSRVQSALDGIEISLEEEYLDQVQNLSEAQDLLEKLDLGGLFQELDAVLPEDLVNGDILGSGSIAEAIRDGISGVETYLTQSLRSVLQGQASSLEGRLRDGLTAITTFLDIARNAKQYLFLALLKHLCQQLSRDLRDMADNLRPVDSFAGSLRAGVGAAARARRVLGDQPSEPDRRAFERALVRVSDALRNLYVTQIIYYQTEELRSEFLQQADASLKQAIDFLPDNAAAEEAAQLLRQAYANLREAGAKGRELGPALGGVARSYRRVLMSAFLIRSLPQNMKAVLDAGRAARLSERIDVVVDRLEQRRDSLEAAIRDRLPAPEMREISASERIRLQSIRSEIQTLAAESFSLSQDSYTEAYQKVLDAIDHPLLNPTKEFSGGAFEGENIGAMQTIEEESRLLMTVKSITGRESSFVENRSRQLGRRAQTLSSRIRRLARDIDRATPQNQKADTIQYLADSLLPAAGINRPMQAIANATLAVEVATRARSAWKNASGLSGAFSDAGEEIRDRAEGLASNADRLLRLNRFTPNRSFELPYKDPMTTAELGRRALLDERSLRAQTRSISDAMNEAVDIDQKQHEVGRSRLIKSYT